jgi:GNAT superfamily N-acetyltransferase
VVDLAAVPVTALDDTLDRSGFSSGVEALDRYFHTQAGQDQRRRIAACFVLVDPSTYVVAGYYTLSSYAATAATLPDAMKKRLPRYGQIPCTLLGRLAVDHRYRSRGLGGHLLADALQRALRHSREVASWAVVVDAKDLPAAAFYRKFGFIEMPSASGRLFLPMHTISRSSPARALPHQRE